MLSKYRSVGLRYRSESDVVLWKEVDEGWVRFDSISGGTHLLSPLARVVIELIEESATDICSSDIVAKVLVLEPDADPADILVEVDATLRILCMTQLIENYCLDRQRPDSV